uniref:NodB homology domain-containing protein n=1 Tax=uncultured Desulfobacterium sp. TaxID=201089 RepID=E1YK53_9BACT|nr:hypothetical protein N47_E51690 [uncultured Desulfobacterium sp.]
MNIDYNKLLQGRYEAEFLPNDFSPERIVPDFGFNILNRLGLLYRPIVDENYLAQGGKKPVWPEGKPFAVCLTHDVDHVTLHSLKQSIRSRSTRLLNATDRLKTLQVGIGYGKDVIKASMHINKKDPLHCYERWLDAEASIGARSTFFFWPGWSHVTKKHISDCEYDLSDMILFAGRKMSVSEMIKEIDRQGWEIGLHPSWYSFDNLNELKKQKDALERVLGHDIVSVRQHYLHYDIRVTPKIHDEAGFAYDSTLGFNDNVGFRFGTCYPWKLYNLQQEAQLNIVEVPLIVQEGAMLRRDKGLRLDNITSFKYVKQITESVKNVGGVLTILWHPTAIMNQDWWGLYSAVLEYLKGENAYIGSIAEIMKAFE